MINITEESVKKRVGGLELFLLIVIFVFFVVVACIRSVKTHKQKSDINV